MIARPNERVDGHRREQDDEPHRVGGPRGSRIDADERLREEIAADEEVRDHPLVPDVGRRRPAEDRGVVEHPEAQHEDPRRHVRVADDPDEPRVDDGEDPLARSAAAVLPGPDRAQRERDRGPADEQDRREHPERHVGEHVRAEELVLVGVDAAVRHPGEDEHAEEPRDRAQHRPPVAAPREPDGAEQVERGRGDDEREPERIRPRTRRGSAPRSGRRAAATR